MRYQVINRETGEPIKGPPHFTSLSKAKKYFEYCRHEDISKYKFCKVENDELKTMVKYYDNALLDLYHEIEITRNPDTLMQLVKIMKDVLKKRRKVKNKLKGLGTGSIMVDAYKYRTTILEDYGFFEEEEIYNW